jgi:hypothetical protein
VRCNGVSGLQGPVAILLTLEGLRGKIEPHEGFHVVPGDTLPTGVHVAEGKLCVSMSLLSRATIPADRLRTVLGDTQAKLVYVPEGELRGGVSLLGREAKPMACLGVVLQPPLAPPGIRPRPAAPPSRLDRPTLAARPACIARGAA